MFRWVVGGRVDRFDYLDDFVFSPRTTFMVKPGDNQTIRVSYNRAYRSPSVINNFLDLTIAEPLDLRPFSPALPVPYLLPVAIVGNPDLKEQSLDAFELGYTGVVMNGRAIVSAAFYVNKIKNDILFTQDGVYTRRRRRRSTGRCRRPSSACSRRRALPAGALHLPELRREHDAGHRARRRTATSTATSPPS